MKCDLYVVCIFSLWNRYSVFWHQYLRAAFEGISRFVVQDCLNIPRNSLVCRYSKILAVFFISGLIHAGTTSYDYDVLGSGSLQFYCTQVIGIIVEDAVQFLYFSYFPADNAKASTRWYHKIIGFIWFSIFITWSTPMWSYRVIRHQRPGTGRMLPFSLVSLF